MTSASPGASSRDGTRRSDPSSACDRASSEPIAEVELHSRVDAPTLEPWTGSSSSTTCATRPARGAGAADGAFTGAAGGAACGDLSRISLVDRGRPARRRQLRRRGLRGDARRHRGGRRDGRRRARSSTPPRLGIDDVEAAARRPRLPPSATPPSSRRRLHRASRPRRSCQRSTAPRLGLAPQPRLGRRAGPRRPERVAVAMSGGVDSAVAALLERERGAEVVGVTVKLWADPETDGAKACCSPEAVLGARAARPLARHPALHARPRGGLPPPRRRPLRRRLRRRAALPTPASSATARCGSRRWSTSPSGSAPTASSPATTPGSSRTATGRCSPPPPTRPRTRATCWRRCRRSCSAASRFPLTELTKPEVREIAARHGLAVAKKPESQDLCFLAGQGKRGFLRRHGGLSDRDGAVLDSAGRAARPPPRPPQLHRRPAPRHRRLRARAALRRRHRRRRQHGHGRHPRGARDPPRPRPRRRPAPRRRPRRRGPPALPLARPAGHRSAAAGAGRHEALEVELGEEFAGASPGPDGGAAGRRDDRRPRHDRRRGLTRRPPAAARALSVCEIFRLPHMKAQEIRDTYLSFFAERGHKVVPSASLVPSVARPLGAAHDRRACSPSSPTSSAAKSRRRRASPTSRNASARPTSRRSATPPAT